MEKLTKNHIFHLSITKGRPRSTHLNKAPNAISTICQDKHYNYIPAIISSNTKPTQKCFLSNYSIKRRHTSKHYIKLGFIDPVIGLDVPSGNSPIDPEMVDNTPIFNLNPKDQQRLDCVQSAVKREIPGVGYTYCQQEVYNEDHS